MTYLCMLLGFLMLTGIALFFAVFLKSNIGEGMFLAASFTMLCMYFSLRLGHVSIGIFMIAAIAATGVILWITGMVSRRIATISHQQSTAQVLYSSYWILLSALFLLALVSFYQDFIQRIDELHMWAAAVKYMQEYERMPYGQDFIGTGHSGFATSLFIVFFQKLTGYSEPHMYAASFLLIWIGWLLPFSGFQKKDWKKPLIYTVLLYFGTYSLYHYGLKTLYVDVHTAAWAGGLAGWWMNRRHQKSDFVVAAVGAATLFFLKPFVGPLMSAFVVVFMMCYQFLIEKKLLERNSLKKRLLKAVPVLIGIGAAATAGIVFMLHKAPSGMPLFGVLSEAYKTRGGSREKILRTFGAILSGLVGKPLAKGSDLKVSFFLGLIIVLLLLKLSADLYRQGTTQLFCVLYAILIVSGYVMALFQSYLVMFSYRESIKIAGGVRYFSVCLLYLLTIALVLLLQRTEPVSRRIRFYVLSGLMIVSLYGLNSDFLSKYTGWDRWHVTHYSDIKKSRSQAKELLSVLESEDRVYFLNQDESNEFPQNVVLYYLGRQVSDYNRTFWKLTENGSITRLETRESPDIYDLPKVLEEGGYTYLWIYRTDDYLSEILPEVFDGVEEVADHQLYHVLYKENSVSDLQLMGDESNLILQQ